MTYCFEKFLADAINCFRVSFLFFLLTKHPLRQKNILEIFIKIPEIHIKLISISKCFKHISIDLMILRNIENSINFKAVCVDSSQMEIILEKFYCLENLGAHKQHHRRHL